MPSEDRPLRLLISFAPEDRELKDHLAQHLQVLVRFAGIELWEADRVRPGDDWRQKVDAALDRADVALVLISSDFLASDLLQDVEVPKLFQRRERAGLKVIPVLLRSCLWQAHPWLSTLAPLPYNREAIASFEGDRRDRALTDVAAEIAERAGALPGRTSKPARRSSEADPAEARPRDARPDVLSFDTKLDHTTAAAVAIGTSPQAQGTMTMHGATFHAETMIFAGTTTPAATAAVHVAERTPQYPDTETRLLSEKLVAAQQRKQRLQEHGAETAEVLREILDLKRRLRQGGQLKAGDLLGRYLLLAPLGSGGFATVWRAEDAGNHRLVAVKVLHSNLAGDPERLARFVRGARIMHGLNHPAVVRVIEPHAEDQGWHYFVMEYLAGGDLRKAVIGKRLSREAVANIIIRICEALEHRTG